jgi:2-polyprenyl-3-methyl-5-hydroxy-6-metoxy-1,4-benzoquinol methylase
MANDIDRVRQYWNNRPCNIRHSAKELGSPEYFDEVTARKYLVEPHIPGFADFASWSGKRVLEIGCGIGTDTEQFARAGATVVAVDLSEESMKLARQRIELRGLSDRVTFFVANAEELSSTVPIQEFDLIYSFGVLHHTPEPDRAFAELAKFMGPHTEVRMMLYHRRSSKTAALVLRHGFPKIWEVDKAVAKQSEAEFGCPYAYTYTEKSINRSLARAGLFVRETDVDHIFPYQIGPYKRYEYKRRWYWAILPKSVFRWAETTFGWHLLITATKS